MNSTEGDISATRKSSRTRLKRDFGTDFIDPTTVRISDKTNRTSDVKRKSQTQSPPLNLDVEEIKKELGEPIQVATDNVRRSDRQVKPSAKMVLVAECAKEIKFDVRDEDQAYNFDDEPEEGTSSSNSYVPTNVKVVKRKTPTMYAYSGSTIDHEKNKPKKAIIQPPPLLEIYSPVGLTAEEEQRLNDEALAKVAVIRAANVQKILEKRSLGKISTGGQAAAQDEEIFRYVTSNGNSELLNKMPNRGSFAKGIPLNNKPATSSSSNPKFVQLMNRTIAVPPSTSSRPPIPIFPVVTSAPRPNQRPLPHMAPKLPVKVFIPSLARKINSSAVPLRDPKIELKDPKAELKDSNTVLKGITIKPRFVIETPRPPFKKPKQEEQEHTNGEKKPEILDEPIIQDEPRTMRPHEHCAIFNNLSTPKPRHGENTTSIRTVTIMPKSMHLNKNGESAGPSLFATNKRPPSPPPVPQPPPIKRTENRTVVYKGADGKMLVKNKVVVVNQHQAQEKPANSTGFPRPIIPIPWPIRTRPLSDFEKYQRGKNKSYTTLPDNVASAKVVRSVNKPVDSQYVLASDKNINLHPNQPQLVLPLPQPIEEQLQTEVKEEPKDEGVKEEPLDDYEHVDNDQEQEKTASSTSPVITSIVVPRPSKEYRKRRMPEVHYERKSASPRQIFLGAEEPMKDSTIYQLKRFTVGTISLTEQKTVERIKQEIPSSECSTASLDGDGREKSFETGNDEVIDAEQIRQKEALAQKITINEYKILDYMKSEDFKKCLPLEKEVTEFGKVFMAPNVLANVPEFSDSLYWSKPDLYMDLTRIHRIKYYEANKTMNGYPIKSTKALGPPQFEKQSLQ